MKIFLRAQFCYVWLKLSSSHDGIYFISIKWVLSLLYLLSDLIGDLYVQYWDGTPSTTVKLIHSLHSQDTSFLSYYRKQMYCFVENTSSAFLLVCKLSNYHQCKKSKQFLSYRRKLPFTLETFTQFLRRKINECQSINTLYDMLCYLTQLLM